MPVVLTVAGSDSGGGAGIQADLKTFEALGVFGVCAITCVTAQVPDRVTCAESMSSILIAEQMLAVCRAFPVAVGKIGMLHSARVVETVADQLERVQVSRWVLDPVTIATSGAPLLHPDAVESLRARLLPMATVVTPNVPEAEALWGHPVDSVQTLQAAARAIGERYGLACVVKGGHLHAESARTPAPQTVVDALWDGRSVHLFEQRAVSARETHGTGCTFSAALAARLALGDPLPQAVRQAQAFVARALARSRPAGRHHPLGWAVAGPKISEFFYCEHANAYGA